MSEGIEITVYNKLIAEQRDLSVYHHSGRSANMISYSSSIKLPLGTVEEGDYLFISVVRGPGNLKQECVVDLPDWLDFSFSSVCDGVVRRSGERTLLTVPPGPPIWQVKVTRSPTSAVAPESDYIAVGDSAYEAGGKKNKNVEKNV